MPKVSAHEFLCVRAGKTEKTEVMDKDMGGTEPKNIGPCVHVRNFFKSLHTLLFKYASMPNMDAAGRRSTRLCEASTANVLVKPMILLVRCFSLF